MSNVLHVDVHVGAGCDALAALPRELLGRLERRYAVVDRLNAGKKTKTMASTQTGKLNASLRNAVSAVRRQGEALDRPAAEVRKKLQVHLLAMDPSGESGAACFSAQSVIASKVV